jgi:hypothetical protein
VTTGTTDPRGLLQTHRPLQGHGQFVELGLGLGGAAAGGIHHAVAQVVGTDGTAGPVPTPGGNTIEAVW